eukprot:m.68445 g.68445  ORF g.68445 m.68445 type:complete len:135 (+) comp8245_c0_seq6:245-649(+)
MNGIDILMKDRLEEFERDVRPMYKSEFLCCAKCCDTHAQASSNELQACLETCKQPVTEIGQLFDKEMSAFKNRLQRCQHLCQMQAKAQLATSSEDQVKVSLRQCVDECGVSAQEKAEEMFRRLSQFVEKKTAYK